jgi:hypothetical protein
MQNCVQTNHNTGVLQILQNKSLFSYTNAGYGKMNRRVEQDIPQNKNNSDEHLAISNKKTGRYC